MYIKRNEIEFIYRTLQDIYNGEEIQGNVLKIDKVILDVCRRNKANNKRVAEYVAEQRKHNKDFSRGKGIEAIKIDKPSYRIIVRVENTPNTIEYGKPLLILLDESANEGLVAYCSYTGHGEGEYSALLKQTRRATEKEAIDGIQLYGYNTIENLKIVDRKRR